MSKRDLEFLFSDHGSAIIEGVEDTWIRKSHDEGKEICRFISIALPDCTCMI